MVIAIYQMARWHDGTKGVRLGKIMRGILQSASINSFFYEIAVFSSPAGKAGGFFPELVGEFEF